MLQQSAQPAPCLQMNPVVSLVAIVSLEVHRDRAVSRDAKAIDELLEIGPVLLAMPPLEQNRLGILTVVGTLTMTLVVSLWICSILRPKLFMAASTMRVCKVARSAANRRSRARPSLSSPILP